MDISPRVLAFVAFLVLLVFIISMIIMAQFVLRITDPDNRMQMDISGFPTPGPTTIPFTPVPTSAPTPAPGQDYRGVAILPKDLDRMDGTSAGPFNPSPFDGTQGYDWLDEQDFHPRNRVPDNVNVLTLPDCIDPGAPESRYLYVEPNSYGTPTSVEYGAGGINQVAVLPRVTEIYGHGNPTPVVIAMTPQPTPQPDHSVYATTWRLNCQIMGGQTITVRP